ncbi:MAG: MerR family transcriptional regulator [Alphaproteobacteria bacterium]|nr:MerR family transcriptional regulator [Alphaproteobacteria bacterium]
MNEGSLSVSTESNVAFSTGDVKSPTAFRTISEVAERLDLPQHVLRFWESKFQQIRPLKRGGGRRYYRPEDVRIIHDIKDLLYNQGFTIRGVQKLLREKGASALVRSVPAPGMMETARPKAAAKPSRATTNELSFDRRQEMEGLLAELKSIRRILQKNGI